MRRSAVVTVDLHRLEADEDSPAWWSTTWGLKNDSVGYTDDAEDLAELIQDTVEDIAGSSYDYDISRIEWTLDGDEPPNRTIAEEIAAAGVVLPTTLPATPPDASTDG